MVNEKGDFEVRDLQNLLNITVQSLPSSLGTHSSDDTRPPSYGVHSMVCDQTEAGFQPECVAIRASYGTPDGKNRGTLDKSLDVWFRDHGDRILTTDMQEKVTARLW